MSSKRKLNLNLPSSSLALSLSPPLPQYLAARKYTVTSVLDRVIKQYLSEEQSERQKTHLEETKELAE
jgi:hypothetical protein